MGEIKTIYPYWKIPVVILFVGLIYLAINLHSEHWISFMKGILFFSDLDDLEQLKLIQNVCFWSVPILSVLFLLIRNKTSNIALITLMIVNLLLIAPWSYVRDPTETF